MFVLIQLAHSGWRIDRAALARMVYLLQLNDCLVFYLPQSGAKRVQRCVRAYAHAAALTTSHRLGGAAYEPLAPPLLPSEPVAVRVAMLNAPDVFVDLVVPAHVTLQVCVAASVCVCVCVVCTHSSMIDIDGVVFARCEWHGECWRASRRDDGNDDEQTKVVECCQHGRAQGVGHGDDIDVSIEHDDNDAAADNDDNDDDDDERIGRHVAMRGGVGSIRRAVHAAAGVCARARRRQSQRQRRGARAACRRRQRRWWRRRWRGSAGDGGQARLQSSTLLLQASVDDGCDVVDRIDDVDIDDSERRRCDVDAGDDDDNARRRRRARHTAIRHAVADGHAGARCRRE